MLSQIKTLSLIGLDGFLIEVQTDIGRGIPGFEIVGLPDASVREAKERIKAAIKNSGVEFPSKKILINLAPANIRKEGSEFDLPMAVGILIAIGEIPQNMQNKLINTIFIGELSLDGKVNRVNGVLPICIEAKNLGIKTVVVPETNYFEASVVEDINVVPVKNLRQVIDYLKGNFKSINVERKILEKSGISKEELIDFSEVKGQERTKRALEIAAAGGHNCLLIGSPGTGKSMIAKRLPTILPELTKEESLEISKIHSIAGKMSVNDGLIRKRPFISPHHTISSTSLIGGGRIPKPGEISLAHYGVLFLDELSEFKKSSIEMLRGPLEDGKVTISRVMGTTTYPSKCMLIASMNPCECGYFGSTERNCTCSPSTINKFRNKISGPILDRIDLQIEVESVKYSKLESEDKSESSEEIKKRVDKARQIQLERYKDYKIFSNSELTDNLMDKFCKLDEKGKKILEKAYETLGLSARAYSKILRVARTIADLDSSPNIQGHHIAEALQYRELDKKYFKR